MTSRHAITPTSLRGVPIRLTQKYRGLKSLRSNGQFSLSVVLTSGAAADVTWSAVNAFTLSYRWYDEQLMCLVPDGLRTSLPVATLGPGVALEVDVIGETPPQTGRHTLKISLVLEGVHWACDVGSDAWCDVEVELSPPLRWPVALDVSRGGKAIRGAIAAAEISRKLVGHNFAVDLPQTANSADANAAQEGESLGSTEGGDVEQGVGAPPASTAASASTDVDELLECASRQGRRISELLALIGEKDRHFRELNERYRHQNSAEQQALADRARDGT